MAERVLVERDGAVATVTVNRPEKRNAMDIDTRRRLLAAFEVVDEDETISVVVLRGAGEKSFIAGGDIQAFAEFDLLDGIEYVNRYAQGLYNYVANVSAVTIAAVDGYALGGGTEIALACDLRVASEDAVFGLPETTLGLLPAGGGTQRLLHVVGVGMAKELILTGRSVDAYEARDIGLVNHVHTSEEFDERVRTLATDISKGAPLAQRLSKASINQAMNLENGLVVERFAGALAFASDDSKEGINAFLDGRDPEFSGT